MSLQDRDRIAAGARMALASTSGPGLQRLLDLAAALLAAPSVGVALAGEVQTIVGTSGRPVWRVGAQHRLSDTVGRTVVTARAPRAYADARADPRVADLPTVRAGDVVAYLGVPLFEATGEHVVGVLAVFGPEPRTWTDTDVATLVQLAGPVVSELELAAMTAELEHSRLRGDLAIEAAGIGIFDWDLATGRLDWDDRMLRLLDYDRSAFPGTIRALLDRLDPDEVDRVRTVIDAAVAAGGPFELEYRALLPSGEVRWMASRGRALRDGTGAVTRLLGAVQDVTRQRHGEAAVARVLESMPAAFFSLGRDWRFSYVNAEAERLLGRTREELIGGDIWELFPAAVDSDFEVHYRGAMDTGELAVFEAYYPAPLDAWYEVRAWPSTDGLSVYFLNVTQRHRADETARQEVERLALLARVTDSLSDALISRRGGRGALTQLMQAVVPGLGDWVIGSLVEDSGRLRDVGGWHRDPDLRPVVDRYAELRLGALRSTAPIVTALATGELTVVPDVAAAVGNGLPAGAVADAYWTLDPGTAVAVALIARGRVLGAMSVYRSRDRAPMNAAEQALLKEVADRVALALDSAALHEQQRRMAEELQRSLLTAPPEPDHSEIEVRYVPAVQAAQVGGDWYDAFLQPGGATVLAIGDVVGHDTVAAAAMGQLRSLLRGIAYSSGGGPAAVLSDLDRAMAGLQVHTLATAAVARLEQTDEERAQGLTRLRWSSAGHPPLLVLHPDGRVEELATERADLLLGVAPERPRREQVEVLQRGATVVLYTDGLVEGPDLPLDDGVLRLRQLLGELGNLPLGELCDQLLQRMRPGGSEDDVALVAVRLHREDRPRPQSAGPEVVPPTP
ncbi:SpoIIE family protein phosphatase [Modestobacter muralis]|uniref:SpoIIE family protein phosphatase n=1 Tax=Modestobacter muralis TaxID=1608614 RepID=A0A6P0H494_9ACTN|nr:SpoIIE family protein phosphatase [Modestobacter muralis]NEK93863.1 SpoIIE family protein phosphatase [Modestobacter muralis]NEN50630.1 SpoIIE family protein phosphatase [Modestobacter muralis]